MNSLETIRYNEADNSITIIDQTKLPNALVYKTLVSSQDVYHAIKDLEVRGAPLIGITAAYGLLMSALNAGGQSARDLGLFCTFVRFEKSVLESARPTAVNLANALNRMVDGLENLASVAQAKELLRARAYALHAEDRAISEAIGRHGADLLDDGAHVMTICNAGLLATANEYGTALAPVYMAQEQGRSVSVTALETRPVLQGARLTTFELTHKGVPTTLICDNMMGWYLSNHHVDAIFVGCDRVATNGDFANKIGTFTLAAMAHAFAVPFYVCLPSTTIDFDAESMDDIEIEFRNSEEVRSMWYKNPMVAMEAEILNPAFDCTPRDFVTGYITEKGILAPPFTKEMFV